MNVDVNNLQHLLDTEWLETNGLGGFASSSIAGANTRRYHGWLVAALHPPVDRTVLLAKCEEAVIIGSERLELSTNQYPGTVHPQGYRYLRAFSQEPLATWSFEVNRLRLKKTLFMPHSKNAVVVGYEVTKWPAGVDAVALSLRPLVAFRDYHSLGRENGGIGRTIGFERDCVHLHPANGLCALFLTHDAEAITTVQDWYRNFEYQAERGRGLDYVEDLYCPVEMKFAVDRAKPFAALIAATERIPVAEADRLQREETVRRMAIRRSAGGDAIAQRLASAADQYIVKRGEGRTVIAGYHWFTDWGRDTMIAFPGLFLSTGRYGEAKDVLRTFAASVDKGMLPNRFADRGEAPEYNTVDATLWFFQAAHEYWKVTGDTQFIMREIYPVFTEIVDWHMRGTRHGIRMDSDGMLLAGEPGVQLTWMDSKIGDWVVTPRHGKPVEIQALWHNALRAMGEFAGALPDQAMTARYTGLANRVRASFVAQFWNEDTGCLYDVVGQSKDGSVRPNQLMALIFSSPLIEGERARSVLRVVRENLLTPYGLRSLAPGNAAYRGHYGGGPLERDSVYHQGTVWPWLLGPYSDAYLEAYGPTPETLAHLSDVWRGLATHLDEAGYGQVSEVFSGDPPHQPGGCIAQAWSVAEFLRVRRKIAELSQAAEPKPARGLVKAAKA